MTMIKPQISLSYRTYNYFADLNSGLSELDEKRLIKAVDSELQAMGYLLSEEPDFLININSTVFETSSGNSVGVGLGGGGGSIGGGLSVGIPVRNTKLQREIIFDFVDASKDFLIWQANTEGRFKENVTPVAREESLQKLVIKAFSEFPPEKIVTKY